jgi:hypothetical protein
LKKRLKKYRKRKTKDKIVRLNISRVTISIKENKREEIGKMANLLKNNTRENQRH